MRFGSVCSGIEAASAAWNGLGWEAAWFAEIEPFPSAVLAHHYPGVRNLGDMTTLPDLIRSGEVEAPDLFCGGTPCQAFSVAGLRQSLSDARGNLSLTFCEIANAIDDVRRGRDTPPAIIFWENVPGVLNTSDNAFGCFLSALAGTDTALVSRSGWTNAGMVAGPRRRVVWRVLDAQGFIPQRRRRVFVLAVANEHRLDPRTVLFDSETEVVGSLGNRLYTGPLFPVRNGLQRDSEAGAEAGKVAPTIPARSTAGGGLGTDFDCDGGLIANSWPAEVAPTLNAHFGEKMGLENQHALAGGGYSCLPKIAMCLNAGAMGRQDAESETLIPTNGGRFSDKYGIPGNWIGRAPENGGNAVEPISIHPHCIGRSPESGPQGKEYLTDGTAYCMDSRGQPQAVAQSIPYGVGEQPETAHCLRSGASKADKHESTTYVAQPIQFGAQMSVPQVDIDLCQTLQAKNPAAVAQPVTYDLFNVTAPVNRQSRTPGDPCHTLARANAEHAVVVGDFQPVACDVADTLSVGANQTTGFQSDVCAVPISFEANASQEFPTDGNKELCQTIKRRTHASVMTPAMAVRRLTPVECERLMGFKDNYTQIPWRNKPAEECPDGPRYKALGNSWAVPVVQWIGKRIAEQLK